MKKVILMIAFVTIAVTNSNAQSNNNRSAVSFGIKAGTNYSNVYDSNSKDFVADSKFGFAAGAFAVIPLGKIVGFQPEVLFSQKGFKSTGTYLGSTYSMTRTTNFIDIPLLLAVKPVDQLTLLFGPQFSYLMKQTDEFTGGTINSTQQQDFNNNNVRKNILGLTGGADINLNSNLVLGLRAAWDIKANEGNGNSSTPRYKNMLYQATIGYKF